MAFSWPEVRRIFGFKRDQYTFDQICVALELQDRTVNENMEGFNSLVEILSGHFPGLDPSWWRTVAFPAFATNWTTIWASRTNP